MEDFNFNLWTRVFLGRIEINWKNYSNLSIERERETVIKKWNGTGANGIIWKLFNYLIKV